MSRILKRNINGILGTILFHLFVIAIAMAFKIKTNTTVEEGYMIIEPEVFDEIEKQKHNELSAEADLSDIEIEKYLNDIRNVGSNNTKYPDVKTMSQEEMRKLYEEEMLRDKYGDDYEKVINSTYEDFLDPDNTNASSGEQNKHEDKNELYSGPALVYVELDNPDRGKTYIEVPVFTCRNGGRVVVSITIGSDGKVKSATVTSATSDGDASCISEAARKAAGNSRFTPIAGGANEYGTITYSFIQQ